MFYYNCYHCPFERENINVVNAHIKKKLVFQSLKLSIEKLSLYTFRKFELNFSTIHKVLLVVLLLKALLLSFFSYVNLIFTHSTDVLISLSNAPCDSSSSIIAVYLCNKKLDNLLVMSMYFVSSVLCSHN